jgi:anti-sigma B factor antagonist
MKQSILSVEQSGDVALIRVHEKKLYQKVVTPFQDEMIAVVDQGHKKLVVNLSEVDVMNSSGLGVLILLWDRLNKEGGKLVITGLRPIMFELFTRMRLDTLFPVVGSEEEAIGLFEDI